jgi:hypothetical protein
LHLYTLILAVSVLVCAACGGAHYLQDRSRRANQLAALLLLGCAHWALILALLSVELDITQARGLINVSAFGWAFIGPLILHIMHGDGGSQARSLRWLRNGLLPDERRHTALPLVDRPGGASARARLVGLDRRSGATDWCRCHGAALVAVGGRGAASCAAQQPLEAERRQLRWTAVACASRSSQPASPSVVLPSLGIPCPPLRPALAVVAAVSVWMVGHFGCLVMAPSSFAGEILRLLPDGVAAAQRRPHPHRQ